MLVPASGPGWIAAGDAAASFDPLASLGIGHAVTSGIHAARVVHAYLTANEQLTAQYNQHILLNVEHYLQLRHSYYLLELRWPDQPFWARRHQSPAWQTLFPPGTQERGQ